MAAKFEISKDHAGKFRFHLKGPNGEIIAASQGYESKASAEKGIEAIKTHAPTPRSKTTLKPIFSARYRFMIRNPTPKLSGTGAQVPPRSPEVPGIGQGPPFQCSMRWWSGVKPFCTPQSTAWVRLSTLILR
jgi:uncharacterized protein YegP (UPF0339 family)